MLVHQLGISYHLIMGLVVPTNEKQSGSFGARPEPRAHIYFVLFRFFSYLITVFKLFYFSFCLLVV